jgi:hypothetical protein
LTDNGSLWDDLVDNDRINDDSNVDENLGLIKFGVLWESCSESSAWSSNGEGDGEGEIYD